MIIGDKYIVTRICMVKGLRVEITDIFVAGYAERVAYKSLRDGEETQETIEEFRDFFDPVENQPNEIFEIWLGDKDNYMLNKVRAKSFKKACEKLFKTRRYDIEMYNEKEGTFDNKKLRERKYGDKTMG